MYARSFGGSCGSGHNLQVTKYPGNVLFCSPAQVPGLVPGLHGRRAAPSSAPFSTLTAHVHPGKRWNQGSSMPKWQVVQQQHAH